MIDNKHLVVNRIVHLLKLINKRDGFTIVEILVALMLMSVIFALVIGVSFDSRKDLQESVNSIERAVRFTTDESSLKNVIGRIHFILDKTPQEYYVEMGPDDSFVLPANDEEIADQTIMSLEEKKKYEKSIDDVNKKFSKIKEFEEENKALPEEIRIIAVGTTINKKLQSTFQSSIYFYPTGEKDGALIILGSSDEVATIEIAPFVTEIRSTYKLIDKEDQKVTLEEKQMKIAEEIFKEWKTD